MSHVCCSSIKQHNDVLLPTTSDNINHRILKLVEFVSLKSEITYKNWGNTQMCRQICSTVCGNFISFPLMITEKKTSCPKHSYDCFTIYFKHKAARDYSKLHKMATHVMLQRL